MHLMIQPYFLICCLCPLQKCRECGFHYTITTNTSVQHKEQYSPTWHPPDCNSRAKRTSRHVGHPKAAVLERSRVRKAVTGEKRSGLFPDFFPSLNNRAARQILDSDLALQVPITQEQLGKGSHQAQWIPLLLTSGHRDNIRPQENMQSTCRFISNLDVHVNLGVGPGFFHWWFSLKEEKQSFFHESRRWLSMSRPPPSAT